MRISTLTGYEYRESLTFSIGYGDEYEDVHIPDIIPIPTISLSPFKLLKIFTIN